jgi:hypothetical protein
MQEEVKLKMVVRKLYSTRLPSVNGGLTFFTFVLASESERVTTDKLLVSDEAVRVLDLKN